MRAKKNVTTTAKSKPISRANAATIDRIVKQYMKLMRIGDRLNLDGLEDMPPRQMKVAIIKAVNPKMRLDGKGAKYIDAALDLAVDMITSMKSTDRQCESMSLHLDSCDYRRNKTSAEAAREKMNKRLINGGDE